MGKTNLKHGLERKLAVAKGDLAAAEKEIEEIQRKLRRLPVLRESVRANKAVIEAAELILKNDHPNWNGEHIKPVRAGFWKSPFRAGERGQKALSTLRESGDWMRPREIAEIMLKQIRHDPDDQQALDKLSNSIGTYLKKYEGELVESRGSFAKEWRVIR